MLISRPNLHGFSQEHDKGCFICQTSRLSIEALKLLNKPAQDFFSRVAKQHHSMCSFLKKRHNKTKSPQQKKKQIVSAKSWTSKPAWGKHWSQKALVWMTSFITESRLCSERCWACWPYLQHVYVHAWIHVFNTMCMYASSVLHRFSSTAPVEL